MTAFLYRLTAFILGVAVGYFIEGSELPSWIVFLVPAGYFLLEGVLWAARKSVHL